MSNDRLISIGYLSRRTGVAVSAIRFYEEKGLLTALRTSGNQRRFLRSDIRRVSFILIAQKLGLALADIERELSTLPQGRTPTQADWERISLSMRESIDGQIALLQRTRRKLEECIGCGCLSLARCQLYNAGDAAGTEGTGPRFVLKN
ncbi:redox-sensitive transcriptional activator SoxR [Novosphingobium beihaiensis]|uniref:Redox-sensitive transcriptional activator SoxR n=1 Tax=Novosphingobium beihaiensis TaxID=2930389 RepID=A0ABT0BS31_9SPHN|nr:redox-sensitive transcriptional activator SoxR [Novosphingobium beihaiensis]MCJ2187770.1 redox-sensitive transcriptional activator SoxR [Novosphingobium beihaiensis]